MHRKSPRVQRFPRLTVSAIFVPALCLLDAGGLLEITLPLRTVEDLCFVMCPTAQWAFFSARRGRCETLALELRDHAQRLLLLLAATAKLWVAVGAAV